MVRSQIGISVDAAYAVQLNKLAEMKGMPISALVRDMLDRQAMLVTIEKEDAYITEQQESDSLAELAKTIQRYRLALLKTGKVLECPITLATPTKTPEAQNSA